MSNDINELRTVLFETLRGLKAGTMQVDTAKAINDTAQTIINSAKVEVDYVKATGAQVSNGFIECNDVQKTGGEGLVSIRRHIMR